MTVLILLGFAALVIAIANAYTLWFGTAAQKPYYAQLKDKLKEETEQEDPEDSKN
ncbi:hypothetical protein GGQ84_000146 [Desulfitispora alkaliphila]|uniref:hypothetical protein n=1 Tax=Desulfitispora alkaliphila TaxID=622674 RepID=UPI003D1C92B5